MSIQFFVFSLEQEAANGACSKYVKMTRLFCYCIRYMYNLIFIIT